jgi:hypothetical protein
MTSDKTNQICPTRQVTPVAGLGMRAQLDYGTGNPLLRLVNAGRIRLKNAAFRRSSGLCGVKIYIATAKIRRCFKSVIGRRGRAAASSKSTLPITVARTTSH